MDGEEQHSTSAIGQTLRERLHSARERVAELDRRLRGGEGAVYRALKIARRALHDAETELRGIERRERRLVWSV